MFRKYIDEYNPKIDYKLINLLNPYFSINNYKEKKSIFINDSKFITQEGMWFKKIKSIYNCLSNDFDLTKEKFNEISKILDQDFDIKSLEKQLYKYDFHLIL